MSWRDCKWNSQICPSREITVNNVDNLEPLLTPEEFRTVALGGTIGRNSIYELIRANRIKHVKVGRKILIPRSEAHDFPKRETELSDTSLQ